MVQPNELRIGNYVDIVTCYPKEKIILEIREDSIVTTDGDIKTLPWVHGMYITEEWLLKFGFGFNKSRSRFNVFENDAFSLFCSFDQANGFQIWFETELSECPLNVEYIHQLQNIYFALTQKELEINGN